MDCRGLVYDAWPRPSETVRADFVRVAHFERVQNQVGLQTLG